MMVEYTIPRIREVFPELPDFDSMSCEFIEDLSDREFVDKFCSRTDGDEEFLREYSYRLEGYTDISKLDVSFLSPFQIIGHNHSAVSLRYAVLYNVLKRRHLEGKIFDFGCGLGGSSIYMARYSQDVVAIDKNKDAINELERVSSGFNIRFYTDNGFNYLHDLEEPLDMITSFYFGVFNCSKENVRIFLNYAIPNLKDNGALVITSDIFTMENVEEVLEVPRIHYLPRMMFVRKEQIPNVERFNYR